MPADATTLLDAIASELTSLYPTIPVKVRRRAAAAGRQGYPGYTEGDPLPAFVLSMNDPEPIDDLGTFEDDSVGYPVVVEYLKAAPPGSFDDDADVRDKRQAIRARLYKPSIGAIATVMDVRHYNRPAYEVAGGGKVSSSGQVFVFTLSETRPT